MTRSALSFVGLCVVAAIALSGCGGGSSTSASKPEAASEASLANVPFQDEGKPQSGGVLKFARGIQPTSMYPYLEPSTGNNPVQKQILEGLVEASPDPSKIAPALATSWEISKNHLVYTFHLRPNVKFSNGQPLLPSDVKWSLEQAANPKTDPSSYNLLSRINKIDIPSPSEVQVTLKEVTPAFLANLTTSIALIVPGSVVKQIGVKEFGFHPVGTGPFMVTKFAPSDPEIVMKKNPYYWDKPMPYLDEVIYKYIEDDSSRVLAVQSDSADIAENVPYSQIEQVENTSDLSLVKQHTFAQDWIMMNGCKAPLNDPRIRQALVYATPLEQINKVVFKGLSSIPATASLPTEFLDPNLKPLPYDPEKAKELLKEAGASDLSLNLINISGDAIATQVGTILQDAWAKAGIHLKVQQTDLTSAITQMQNGSYELGNLQPTAIVSDVPVDDEFDEFVTESRAPEVFPWICWKNQKAAELVKHATTTWSDASRRKDFSEYQEILKEEQPILGIANVGNLFAIRDTVHNFVSVGAIWPLLKGVWLSSE